MKKIALMLVFAILLLSPQVISAKGGVCTMRYVSADLEGVKRVVAQSGVMVEIVSSDRSQIEISGDSLSVSYVKCDIDGDVLTIKCDTPRRRVFKCGSVLVKVPYNNAFNAFKIDSGAHISSCEVIECQDLRVRASSNGNVQLSAVARGDCSIVADSSAEVDLVVRVGGECRVEATSASEVDLAVVADRLIAEGSSAADIELQGRVVSLNASATSASEIDAEDLTSGKHIVKSGSAGRVKLN